MTGPGLSSGGRASCCRVAAGEATAGAVGDTTALGTGAVLTIAGADELGVTSACDAGADDTWLAAT